MNTRIIQTGSHQVTLRTGDIQRVFWLPVTTSGEAYIRERARPHKGDDPQVCSRLAHSGHALMATPDTIVDVIRREYQLARRDAQRVANAQ